MTSPGLPERQPKNGAHDGGLTAAGTRIGALANALLNLGVELDIGRVENSWSQVLRELYLVDVLRGYSLVAVAGVQGVGKTQLVSNLYPDAGDWLKSNLGRGEKIPVAVIECAQAAGIRGVSVHRGRDRHHGLTVRREYDDSRRAAWQRATRDGDDDLLLTFLEVPLGFWGVDRSGFLLLPGYEEGSQEHWQHLMKTALSTSPSALWVTDEPRLAQSGQAQLLQYVRDLELAVAITHCDNDTPQRIAERIDRAAQVCAVAKDRIVGIGGAPGRPKGWTAELRKKTEVLRSSPAVGRRYEARLLYELVREKVMDVVEAAEAEVDHDVVRGKGGEHLAKFLEMYDAQADAVMKVMRKEAKRRFAAHHRAAKKVLDSHLAESGLADLLQRLEETLRLDPTGWRTRLQDQVANAWHTDGEAAVYRDCVRVAIEQRSLVTAAFNRDVQTADFVKNVLPVLAAGSPARLDADSPSIYESLTTTIKALPVMALHARAFMLDFAAPDGTIAVPDGPSLEQVLGTIDAETKALIRPLASIVGGDGTEVDIAGFVKKVAPAAGAAAAAGAAVFSAAIGAAALGVAAINAANQYAKVRADIARTTLDAYRMSAEQNFLENIRDILDLVREVVAVRLGSALGADADERDRFQREHWIGRVKEERRSLLEALRYAE